MGCTTRIEGIRHGAEQFLALRRTSPRCHFEAGLQCKMCGDDSISMFLQDFPVDARCHLLASVLVLAPSMGFGAFASWNSIRPENEPICGGGVLPEIEPRFPAHGAGNRGSISGFCTCHFAAEFIEPGVASLNDVSEDYKDHVRKHMPILRQKEFGLARAANYLESWIDGTLVRMPLLDLNQPFDFKFTRDCFKLLFQFDARSTAGLQILAKLRCEDATSTQF